MQLRVRLHPILVTLTLTAVASKLTLMSSPTYMEGENVTDCQDSHLTRVFIDIREKCTLCIINGKVYASSKTVRDLGTDMDFLAGATQAAI